MVNVNAIELLTRYIKAINLRQMKRWSERVKYDISNRRPRCLRKIIHQIKDLLVMLSGDDVVDMLKGRLFQKKF